MMKLFSLSIDERLRAEVKAAAALNGYRNMNELIVEAVQEKINKLDKQKSKEKTRVSV